MKAFKTRRHISGSGNPQLVRMGEQIRKLKTGETERFVMRRVSSSADRNLWRARMHKHLAEFGVQIQVRWFEHIMVVERK